VRNLDDVRVSKSWATGVALTCLIILVGCDGYEAASVLPSEDIAPPVADNLPLVPHPEYANWSQFSVGAAVVRNKIVSNGTETVRVTTTLRLAEKKEDKVVVENQISVDRPGQPLIQNPPFSVELPDTFPLPANMRLEQFSLPSLKAKQIGEEIRQVGDRDYKTELFTWVEVNETGPMTIKLWRSDDVPGRFLRQEIKGHNHDSLEEVVEITHSPQ